MVFSAAVLTLSPLNVCYDNYKPYDNYNNYY